MDNNIRLIINNEYSDTPEIVSSFTKKCIIL